MQSTTTLVVCLCLLIVLPNTSSAASTASEPSTKSSVPANLNSNDPSDTTMAITPNASSAFSYAVLKNGTDGDDNSEAWEESHSEEFLETINNGTLTRGAKVQEVKSQWNTNVGHEEAEATE
uniref:Salivary secreted peptide n=1 Tax=Globodera pallida TaxID=36090 RepID=A0A183BY93_GLOPA